MTEKAEADVPRKATQTVVVETAAKKPIMARVAEETTESCYNDATKPERRRLKPRNQRRLHRLRL